MHFDLFQTRDRGIDYRNQNVVYLVSTPSQSLAVRTIEQVLEIVEPFVLEESIHTGESDLLYEIPYFLDCQGYAKGNAWEVSLAPNL